MIRKLFRISFQRKRNKHKRKERKAGHESIGNENKQKKNANMQQVMLVFLAFK